ncbi:putative phosphatidylinositol-4-phosphate 5-kinase, core, GPCR, family 2 [Plasmopara halstedii]
MEEDTISSKPPEHSTNEFGITSGTSAFSVSPSSSPQSTQILQRSVGDTNASTFSVSPSPLSSPLHSTIRPLVNTTTTLPPIEPSSDSESPLKSALRNFTSSSKPQLSRRVSIEESNDFQYQDRTSTMNQSTTSESSDPGLIDSGVSTRFSTRFRRKPTKSKTSHRQSFYMRDSVISKMSTTVHDPLELSPNQEFDLAVIDEIGELDDDIGHIFKPHVECSKWSRDGYIVFSFGLGLLLIMIILAMSINTLEGYIIDPGLVFGSLLTLILCVCVFVTYHGVQSYQKHPNPLIYYKCVIDICLALRFLMDPLLLDLGAYKAYDEASCTYLSGLTQFLYLSSDCWYFAVIVDLYWSLTNPFMSVKANRRRFKIIVYTAGVSTGLFAALVPGVHGLADGNYCWTKRKTTSDPIERDFFRLNRGSWILFYMWMILFYLSGIAVLIFGIKRLRSGLRDTLQSRREMLRNGSLSIMSYTIYWTIVFLCLVFRAFTFTLSARGVVDYLVWFTINTPSVIYPNWLKFSSDSADKQFSAQLNTALQEELIYFTIEGMTRAIQSAEEDLLRLQGQKLTQELLHTSENESDSTSSSFGEAATRATGAAGCDITNKVVQNIQRNRILTTITEAIKASRHRHSSTETESRSLRTRNSPESNVSFDIPQEQRSRHQQTMDRRHNPSSASTVATSNGHPAPILASKNTGTTASIRFTPYKPEAFAKLRQAFEIKASDFIKSFQTSTKPNISEGASEARFLCEIADKYTDYFILNRRSLITKFYGCFKITMYDRRFYFIVMENLFDVMAEGVQIHHRFDIKGSWVNRSYRRPRRGAKVKCRHCSMMFRYGAQKKLLHCPNVVGLHEPNVVLKDNDLRTRMRIGTDEGVRLFEQLRNDSLCHGYRIYCGSNDKIVGNSMISERTAVNTATNRASQPLTEFSSNDSFVSGISSSTDCSSLMDQDIREEGVPNSKRSHLSLDIAPSVHSLFHQPDDPLNMSRYPFTGSEPRSKSSMRKSTRVFGPGYYYVGIIDILQTWTLQKRFERFWKVDIQQKDGDGLSAIDPVRYQRRFESKLREIISIPKEYFHRQRNQQAVSTMFQSVQRLSPVLQAATAFEDAGVAVEVRRELARTRNDSTDTTTSGNAADDGDLEQAGRNPLPILLPFNQRLISRGSTRSQLSLTDFVV